MNPYLILLGYYIISRLILTVGYVLVYDYESYVNPVNGPPGAIHVAVPIWAELSLALGIVWLLFQLLFILPAKGTQKLKAHYLIKTKQVDTKAGQLALGPEHLNVGAISPIKNDKEGDIQALRDKLQELRDIPNPDYGP